MIFLEVFDGAAGSLARRLAADSPTGGLETAESAVAGRVVGAQASRPSPILSNRGHLTMLLDVDNLRDGLAVATAMEMNPPEAAM